MTAWRLPGTFGVGMWSLYVVLLVHAVEASRR